MTTPHGSLLPSAPATDRPVTTRAERSGRRAGRSGARRACVLLAALLPAFGPACDGDSSSATGGGEDASTADAQPGALAGFAVVTPQALVEGRPFELTVRAQSDAGGTLATWAGDVTIAASRGAIAPATVTLVGGEATVQATLSREGTVTLTLTGGGVSSTATPDVGAMRWSREPANGPVAKAGADGSWRYAGWHGPSVATADAGVFVAAFATGAALDADGLGDVIGLASSSDGGMSWVVEPEEAVLVPADFDADGLANPHVLRDGGTWHLWVETVSGSPGAVVHGIRHATSADGVHFTPDECPLFGANAFGDWTSAGIGAPSAVLRDDGGFVLWFTAWNTEVDGVVARIGRTEGMTGPACASTWAKATIVVDRGPKTSWNAFRVFSPFVWQDGDVWRMLFAGVPRSDAPPSIGYATSADAIAWEPSPSGPVLVHELLDAQGVLSPSVVSFSDRWALFFEGIIHNGNRSTLWRAVPE